MDDTRIHDVEAAHELALKYNPRDVVFEIGLDQNLQLRTREVPAQRTQSLWTTSQACAYVASMRGITPESARRWLGRHVAPEGRDAGRDGENLWPVTTVRRNAIIVK